MPVEKAIPLPEACARSGAEYILAWRLVISGRIPAQRVGGRWFVRTTDLRRVFALGPVKPAA